MRPALTTKVSGISLLTQVVQAQGERGPGTQDHLMLSRATNQDIQAIL
jgi:hypothetical protein